jgi:hypothetical protein
LSLALVGYSEGDFGLPWLYDDVTTAADDHRSSAFFGNCDQGHMVYKVDVHEKGDFLFCKGALCPKETSAQGFRGAMTDGFGNFATVIGSQRADFDAASVAQRLNRRICSRFNHEPSGRLCTFSQRDLCL